MIQSKVATPYDPRIIEPSRFDHATKTVIGISGMMCTICRQRVEESLASKDGVVSAVVDLPMRRAYIAYEPEEVTLENLVDGVTSAGLRYRMPFRAQILGKPGRPANRHGAGTPL